MLARAMQPEIKPINRWDLVQDAFGARRLDPALTRSENRWIAEALLDAQPAGGWRRLTGPVLTRATALNRLAATRLGITGADDSAVDAAALLQWTTDASAVASFLQLRDAERVGLTDWLIKESIGPVADVVFAMAVTGRIPEAVPFGLVVAALYGGAGRSAVDRQPRIDRRRSRDALGAGPSGGALSWRPIRWSTGVARVRRGRRITGHQVDGQRARAAGGRALRAGRGHPRRTRRRRGRRRQPSRWTSLAATAGCSRPDSTPGWPRSPRHSAKHCRLRPQGSQRGASTATGTTGVRGEAGPGRGSAAPGP